MVVVYNSKKETATTVVQRGNQLKALDTLCGEVLLSNFVARLAGLRMYSSFVNSVGH